MITMVRGELCLNESEFPFGGMRAGMQSGAASEKEQRSSVEFPECLEEKHQ